MIKPSKQNQDEHFAHLREAYRKVGDQTWSAEDFSTQNLEVSRNLFTPESLLARNPQPNKLEVYALLSGLSFSEEFTGKLVSVQMQISEILDQHLHYWVAPQNLGVEYCVFKWPAELLEEKRIGLIRKMLASICQPCFRFSIGGVQVNPDGCVVAKGFDEDSVLFRIRGQLKAGIPFLPPKQSGWAHVPLGRILEPLGKKRFAELGHLMETLSELQLATTKIKIMKLVHETRWYMENRTILAEYPLACSSEGLQS